MIIHAETQQKQLVPADASNAVQRFGAYGVMRRGDEILVVKTHSDNWEIPGGTPEPGETLQQGLTRELKEEVGLRAKVGRLFYMRESFYSSPSGKLYHSLQFYFMVTALDSPIAGEAKSYAFMPIKKLTKNNTNTSSYLAAQHIMDGGLEYDLWGQPPTNRRL